MKRYLLLLAIFASTAQAAALTDWANLPASMRSQIASQALMVKGTDNKWYAMQVDQATGLLPVSGSFSLANDTNYGVVGANTLRSAAQIGNATGAADFGHGAVGAQTLRSVSVLSNGTAAAAYGTGVAGSTVLRVVLASDQSAVPISNLPTTVDTNYGAVGASTPRSAAQIGNATGAADFNSGAAGAQTLRTVLATRHEAVATPLATQLSNGSNALDYGSGAAGATTLRSVLATRHEAVATPLAAQLSNGTSAIAYDQGQAGSTVVRVVHAGADVTKNVVASNNYASTSVTTAAYVQLIASTANAINTVCLSNSSGSIIIMATGAALSEADRIYVPAGGSGCFQDTIAASTRISMKALDATASVGYFLFTGIQ